jgi:hypothetical protein
VYGQPLHRPRPPPWLVQSLSATLCSTWVPLCIGHRATHERSPPPAPIPPRAAQPCIMHPAPVNGEMLPETAQVESSQGVTSCVSACASYTGIAPARSPERHRYGTLDAGGSAADQREPSHAPHRMRVAGVSRCTTLRTSSSTTTRTAQYARGLPRTTRRVARHVPCSLTRQPRWVCPCSIASEPAPLEGPIAPAPRCSPSSTPFFNSTGPRAAQHAWQYAVCAHALCHVTCQCSRVTHPSLRLPNPTPALAGGAVCEAPPSPPSPSTRRAYEPWLPQVQHPLATLVSPQRLNSGAARAPRG